MLKKILIYVLLFFSIFLASCGSNKQVDDKIDVKFWNYVLEIPHNYLLSTAKVEEKDIDVLYAYKAKTKNFYSSLFIGKYNWPYPKDEKVFFDSILDKLRKNLIWVEILDTGDFKVDENKLYYVKYKVNDNLFWWKDENVYYWFQSYILDKQDKIVYIISYLSLEEDELNNIFDSVKNLKVNK